MNSSSFNISINGIAAGTTAVDGNFTIYANPYTVVRQNQCTKHFFLGAQRILTKISSADVSKTFYEGNAQDEVANIDYSGKQTSLEENMHLNTEKLNIGWYRNTHGQVPSAHIKHYLLAKEHGGLSGQNPWAVGDDELTDSTQVTSPTYEQKQYFYHPDHPPKRRTGSGQQQLPHRCTGRNLPARRVFTLGRDIFRRTQHPNRQKQLSLYRQRVGCAYRAVLL